MVAATNTKSTPDTETPDVAEKIHEQLLSSVRQGQQLSVDVAQAWVKAVSVLPAPDLSKVPAVPGVQAVSKFTFDVAADLLNAQRDFALQLTNVLVTEKSV